MLFFQVSKAAYTMPSISTHEAKQKNNVYCYTLWDEFQKPLILCLQSRLMKPNKRIMFIVIHFETSFNAEELSIKYTTNWSLSAK